MNSAALKELSYVLYQFTRNVDDHFLWTKKGLGRKAEWGLVRRLALLALEELQWPGAVTQKDLADLICECDQNMTKHWEEDGYPWSSEYDDNIHKYKLLLY